MTKIYTVNFNPLNKSENMMDISCQIYPIIKEGASFGAICSNFAALGTVYQVHV